jgi:hypothetical protein
MRREKPATVQFKVRLKPALHASLAAAAAEREVSLNAEVVSRLERTFFTEEEVFGGAHTATLMQLLGMTARLVEQATGRKWTEDAETHREMRKAVAGVLAVFELPGETGASAAGEQALGLRAAVRALRSAGLSKEQIERHFSPQSALSLRAGDR